MRHRLVAIEAVGGRWLRVDATAAQAGGDQDRFRSSSSLTRETRFRSASVVVTASSRSAVLPRPPVISRVPDGTGASTASSDSTSRSRGRRVSSDWAASRGRIDVPARRRVVAVPRRIEVRQLCEVQLRAPGQGRAHFGGPSSSPTSPPRSGAVPLRVGSPLLRLQHRDLHVERLDPRPRLGRFRRVPRVRRSGLPGRSRRLLVGATYRSGFSSGAPDDRCGGFSRRRSAAAASPASRARASCVAWFSDVTPSATPARSNAQFISAAHACRVSSSYARGFVRSLFLALPDAGSPLAGAARRNHCSAARATPSFTRSENTRWRCGLSATPAFFEWPA